jgi:protein SCO1/2
MRKKTFAAAVLLAAATLTLSACGSGDDSQSPVSVVSEDTATQAATVLDTPFEKPDLVLTDTHGKKYDLRAESKGRPTLIYFGYTHCPDICPLTMNNIAVAKKSLSKAEQDKLLVVFVTTDPARDTPSELGKWLKGIDTQFVGLTGNFATIQAAARTVGVGIEPPVKQKDGSITVTHGAEVLAFWPKDDKGHVLYMSGTSAEDFQHDLPKIIRSEAP